MRRWRGRGAYTRPSNYEPNGRIDTRPHAVFFSLLALLMLLIASATRQHAVTIHFPPPNWPNPPQLGFPTDRIIVTPDNRILWNSQAVSIEDLVSVLQARLRQPDARGLIFDPAGEANYAVSLQVLAQIKRTGNAEAGFCFGDLSKYRSFSRDSQVPAPSTLPSLPCMPQDDSRLRPPQPSTPMLTPAAPPIPAGRPPA